MTKVLPILYAVGALLILIGAVVYFTGYELAPYLYLVGAVIFTIAQFKEPYHKTNFTIKRLRRQQIIGSLFLILTGIFMLTTRGNEWIVCLSIAALIQLYTAFRIPQELKKIE